MPDNETSAAELPAVLDQLTLRTRELEIGANGFARAMTGAFSRAAVNGKQFDDVLKSLALRLSDLALKMALRPLTKSLASGIESLFKGLFDTGGGAQASANVPQFASGGVIGTPSYFPLGRGLGLAGEAGPEAILPLARGTDGKLGVASASPTSAAPTVNISIATPDAGSFRRSETYVTGLIARAVARGQRGL
jgi:phage-related minor tail protein